MAPSYCEVAFSTRRSRSPTVIFLIETFSIARSSLGSFADESEGAREIAEALRKRGAQVVAAFFATISRSEAETRGTSTLRGRLASNGEAEREKTTATNRNAENVWNVILAIAARVFLVREELRRRFGRRSGKS